jgi:hypothetical protein
VQRTYLRYVLPAVFPISLLILYTACYAENIDPDNTGSQYAWSENAGWFNAEPNGEGGAGVTVWATKLTGFIWVQNIGYISLSCENSGLCETSNYRITNDGNGTLSGYAWSEAAGWINFNPTHGGIAIDPVTGKFSGYAWGENIGWIKFDFEGFTNSTDNHVNTSWRLSGDVGSNGFISLEDAILVLQVCSGIDPASAIHSGADVNDDNKIGLEEAIFILQKVAE